MSWLNAEALTLAYPRQTQAVFADLSFAQKRQEFLSIVGPSGVGKSSLLSVLAGFLAPSAGVVRFKGDVVSAPSAERAVIFQNHHLFPWKTALENITFPLHAKGMARSLAREKARAYLAMVKLERFADLYPAQLSGGMQQRVALARALAADPDLLLMDEPFAALDPFTRRHIQREVLSILQPLGKSLILVTHNIEEAIFFGDRVLVLGGQPAAIRGEFRPSAKHDAQLQTEILAMIDEIGREIL